MLLSVRFVPNFSVRFALVSKIHSCLFPIKRHVLKGGVESRSGVSTPSWSGVSKTPSWSVVYDFTVDVFCKLGIDK